GNRMPRAPAAGPSATAPWTQREAGTAGRSLPILVLPDAANVQREEDARELFYALPAAAQLARDRAGHPAFSLALVLSRRPAADEDDIFSLIDSAAFACDVSIALPDSVTRADTLLPLFASQATFRLVAGGAAGSAGPGPALAEAT